MAYPYPAEKWLDGDYGTPHEMNNEFRNVGRTINGGLDKDNLSGAAVTAPRTANDAMSRIWYNAIQIGTPIVIQVNALEIGLYWVPLDSIVIDALCLDGTVQIDLSAYWQMTFGAALVAARTQLCVAVDGVIVAECDMETNELATAQGMDRASQALTVDVPVAAGVRRITPMLRWFSAAAANTTIIISRGALGVRNVRR